MTCNRKGQRGHATVAIYLRHITLTAMVIGTAFLFQITFIYDHFEPRLVIAPSVVTLFIGLLLGRIASLKHNIEERNERFRAVADLAQEFTYYQRSDGGFDYISPACTELTGYTPEELMAKPALLELLVHPEDLPLWQEQHAQLRRQGTAHDIDIRILHRNGEIVWISHTAVPVYDREGVRIIGIRSTNLDITQRKNYEEKIEWQAHYDPLTGLPNRRELIRLIDKHIAEARQGHTPFAVLFLDLDRFKYLNDSHGHALGDQVLTILGTRLSQLTAECCIVSRFGGDEFVVISSGIDTIEAAKARAHKLLELVEQPIIVEHLEFILTGSIGIALYPDDGESADTLIRNADAAMYRSKHGYRSRIERYTPGIVADAASFIRLETEVRKGLKNGEFIPHYQPKVSLENSAPIGFEALARWQRTQGQAISPDEFIPVAEETGMIHDLGHQMLVQVCRQLRQWQDCGRALPVAVNVSARQFADAEFVNRIKALIEEHQINPALLELEITEQVLINDFGDAIDRVAELKALGIRIALDDFGTGYSSLSYLRQLPIDVVKIDRGFLREVKPDSKELIILKNIITLCNELRLDIVAEGIENFSHLHLVRRLGCRFGQGYYFHKPLPQQEISALLI